MSLALLFVGLPGVSCSLILDFEQEDRPCTDRRECLAGFSCEVSICKRDGVQELTKTCFSKARCLPGLVCAGFLCRSSCPEPGVSCTEGLCMPAPASGDLWELACQPSSCSPGTCAETDAPGTVCVTATSGGGICEQGCAVDCIGTTCSDSCPNDAQKRSTCQPLGAGQDLVCLGIGTARAGDGCRLDHGPSGNVRLMCGSGLACVGSGASRICRAYCDTNAASPCADAGNTCTAITANFSVCQ